LKLLQMDAYVHPATQENSPNALAEAMSLGLPCAVSRAGGSSEQIREGISGLAFDPLNFQEACGVISMISRDTSLGTRLGAAALAEARERHHPARVIEQTLSGYHRILSGDGEVFPCAHS
jgi:glycosyltransferase involved in cell wall biosynthesis